MLCHEKLINSVIFAYQTHLKLPDPIPKNLEMKLYLTHLCIQAFKF